MKTAATNGFGAGRLLILVWLASIAVAALLLLLAFAVRGWSESISQASLRYAGLIPIWVTLLVIIAGAVRTQLKDGKNEHAKQVAFFEASIKNADRQLSAIWARAGGEYRRGEFAWERFAPAGLVCGPDEPAPSVWGQGSLLCFVTGRWQVEVTFGVEPMSAGLTRAASFVLVPRVTVGPAEPNGAPPLDRHASWAIQEDTSGLERLTSRALALAGGRERMSPAVADLHASLRELSSKIICFPNRVEVTGRAVPKDPAGSTLYGHGDFAVESQLELIQRALAFVRGVMRG